MVGQHTRPTQCQKLAAYLSRYGSVTALEAIRDLGILNLKGRIFELRERGFAIKTNMIAVKNRWGEDARIARYELDIMNQEEVFK